MKIQPMAEKRHRFTFDEICSHFKKGDDQIILRVAGRVYLVLASYDERPTVKAELFAARTESNVHFDDGKAVGKRIRADLAELNDTLDTIIMCDEHQKWFTGNYVDEEGHEYLDESEPQTLSGRPKVLARKLVIAAELHRVRTAPLD
jgi:hypothetical protein